VLAKATLHGISVSKGRAAPFARRASGAWHVVGLRASIESSERFKRDIVFS
jgi:hypothetical protein